MSMPLMVTLNGTSDVKVPNTPNFIRRIGDDFPIPIDQFTDAQLRKIAAAWRDALLSSAAAKRGMRK